MIVDLLKRVLGRRQPSLSEELESLKLRQVFLRNGIDVGLYSYGCFDTRRIARNCKIGRYCSFAPNSYVFRRNHGTAFLGTTPYFYEPKLGLVDYEVIDFNPLVISDDVWMGHNAVILPGANSIGRGAVIAAGAVVTRDVAPYSIVVGNPARHRRFRFSPEVIDAIEETRWWERTPWELLELMKQTPQLFHSPTDHFKE